jgi:polar amino acid transport system substrate-binding protein
MRVGAPNQGKRLVSTLLSLGCAAGAWAHPLEICTEVAPPWQSLAPDGSAAGPFVEVVREIQKRVGNPDPIRILPWARGYAMIQGQENVVLFPMGRTKDRNTQFQWVGPVAEGVYSLYVRTDSTAVIRNLEDAKGLHCIGVYRDDTRDQMLTEAGFTNLERTTDNVMNAKKLMAGRIDAMVSSSIGIQDLMAAAGFSSGAVRPALPLSRIQFWIAFSSKMPGSVVKSWSRAFEAMKRDRSLEKIMRKGAPTWVPPGPPVTQFP